MCAAAGAKPQRTMDKGQRAQLGICLLTCCLPQPVRTHHGPDANVLGHAVLLLNKAVEHCKTARSAVAWFGPVVVL